MHALQIFKPSLFHLILSIGALCTAEQAQNPLVPQICQQDLTPHRIAIIGAGAGGSSAAYYLNKFANTSKYDVPIAITIFDDNSRAGGRSTTVNVFNDPRFPVELGASIFVKVNHILYNATREFGLQTESRSRESTGSAYEFGVWDGETFVFTAAADDDDDSLAGRWRGWWDIAKLIWKYGLSPIKANRMMKDAIGRFLHLYGEQFPFPHLDPAIQTLGLNKFTGVSGDELLREGGVSEQFAREIVQASTRGNYVQNLATFHGLETMVCLATDGAMAVEGGNWQIFDRFVRQSGATAKFESTVTAVSKSKKAGFIIESRDGQSPEGAVEAGGDQKEDVDSKDQFDTIILAAPLQFANITFEPPLSSAPPKVDYVSLHVTLFTSPYLPSPSFFGLESQSEVPDMILTTLPPKHQLSDGGRGSKGVGPVKFWTLSTNVLDLDTAAEAEVSTNATHNQPSGRQYLYKIFSPEPVPAMLLADIFDFSLDSRSDETTTNKTHPNSGSPPISSLPSSLITWHHVKIWNSFPYLTPTTSFTPFRLDEAENIYYTSAIEPFISTMETSALAGMNVARLIVNELERNRDEGQKLCHASD